jgi:outer membrane protein assembly factor BamB
LPRPPVAASGGEGHGIGVLARTGRLFWKYEAERSISNNAIVIAEGRVYLIDRPLAPADRLVLVPDGSSKCVCSYQM